MSRWPKEYLGQLMSLEYGRSLPEPQRDSTGDYLVAGSNGPQGFHSEAFVKAPGIVVGRKGSAGQVNWFDQDFWPIDTTYFVVPKTRLNLRWLFYCLRAARLPDLATATGVPGLNRNDVYEIQMGFPPLPEQERIVRILDEAEALGRLRQDIDGRTQTLIESVYLQIFWDSKDRKSGDVESVDNIAQKREGTIRTGPFGSQLLHSEFVDEGVPVLGIENVVTNEFRWTAQRCIPVSKYSPFERFRVFPGDVLVTIMGTVGRCCVAPDDLPLCMSTKHLCVITPDLTKIHPRFLWAALLFDPGIRQQTGAIGGGAIMEGWNSTIIRQLKLRIPPLALQHKFAARIAEIRELEGVQVASRQRLDELFRSLLNRALQEEL